MTAAADRPEYQVRLALFARVMFWSFVALRIGEVILYWKVPVVKPHNYALIVTIGAMSLLLLAGMRWLVLVRKPLAHKQLAICDLIMMTGCGIVFGATAVLAWNRPESAYTCLIYAVFMGMMRTIVVPSELRLTAVITGTALVPLVIGAGVLALTTRQDVPGPAFFAGGVMYSVVAIAVACTGSDVIYGLRRQVSSQAEIGQYRLIRRVGVGATSEVFVARHALLRRPTAIKLVQPSAGADVLARCERAVQQMSQLRHHNTVAIYDYGRSPDGVFYVAMEYLEGISAKDLLERDGLQPLPRVIALLQQLCASLHEAHERELAHGNLALANVILCERGGLADTVKVCDFGFAGVSTPARDLEALSELARTLLGDGARELEQCFDGSTTARELAAKLRDHSHATWSQAQAREWWANYRRTSDPFMTVPATLAIDLASRAT